MLNIREYNKMTKKKKSPVTEKAQNEELQEELQTEDKPEIIEPVITEAEEISDLKNQLLRTLADNEKAGLPTEDIVDAILDAINPLLPTPQRIIFD